MSASLNDKRLRFLTAISLVFFIIIIGRLFYIQIIKSSDLAAKAETQRRKDIQLLAKRGTIRDRDGKELAVSVEKQTVVANPFLIQDKDKVAGKLSKILKKDEKDIFDMISARKGFVYIERKLDKEKADKIKALEIEGISLFDEYKRYYPAGSIASQVLGFVGMDNNGLSGIEKEKDRYLSGKFGRQISQYDALGREIPGSTALYLKPLPGKDLWLTIDTEIQYKAEEVLKSSIEEWGAKAGTVIVMNPKNGEIYAMANAPDFELNKFNKATNEQMKNRSVVDVFEPGSTMKPFFAAAAIEEKIFNSDSMFYLPSSINVNGKSIGEAHERAAVNYSLSDIITHSSNVGMSKVGIALGKEKIVKYAKKFGFQERTGIEFPGEVSGYIPPVSQFYGPTVATVCFGQGISTTALQLARGYASFANGGILVNPVLIKKEEGKKKRKVKKPRRVISKKTAWEITLMLEKVVKEGTGDQAKVPGYTVAGKTGTAQKPEGGRYGSNYLGLFAGFAPAEDAKVLVVVILDEPSKAIYGGVVAAPAFSKIMEYSLSHLEVSPN